MTLSSAYIGADSYETKVEDDRNLVKAVFNGSSGALSAGSFALTPAAPGAGLALNAAAGSAVLAGFNSTSQGSYFVWNDVVETIPWVAPDTLPRIDTLLLQVADPQYGALTTDAGPQWIIATGNPAGSPVALSDSALLSSWVQPGAYMKWANVAVNPGDTSFSSGDITPLQSVVYKGNRVMNIVRITTNWPLNNTYIGTTDTIIGGGSAPQQAAAKLQKTFTVLPNRLYKVTATFTLVDADAHTAADFAIRYASGSTVANTSTIMDFKRINTDQDSSSFNQGGDIVGYMNGLAAGTYTVGVFMHRGGASGNVRLLQLNNKCAVMTIEDMGESVTEG